jgi:hypothetical protein
MWTGFIWLSIATSWEYYEYGNKFSGPIQCGEFLDHLSDYQLLKKDAAVWSYDLSIEWVMVITPFKSVGFRFCECNLFIQRSS